jgi:hypothetical protein
MCALRRSSGLRTVTERANGEIDGVTHGRTGSGTPGSDTSSTFPLNA